MDPLAGLDALDWAALSHAYGDATDTPGLLRDLGGPDWESALDGLAASILHQGTVYPATIPAIAFLASIAGDAAAPGRWGALAFLTAYADSVAAGWTTNAHYLPDDTDIVAFDRDARAALASAAQAVVRLLLPDADAEVRAQTARLLTRVPDLPSGAEAALHAALDAETEDDVVVALAAALSAHGRLSDDERAGLAAGSPRVRFAVAWLAARAGDVAANVEQLGSLWESEAAALEASGTCGDAVATLVGTLGTRSLPVLDRLADGGGVQSLHAAILGYTTVFRGWRSGLQPAVAGLVRLAARFADDDQIRRTDACPTHQTAEAIQAGQADEDAGQPDLRVALVHSLSEAVPGVRSDAAALARLCDALDGLARTAPAPVHPAPSAQVRRGRLESLRVDVRADAAVGLLRAGDPRWAGWVIAVRDATDGKHPTAVPAARTGSSRMPLSAAVEQELRAANSGETNPGETNPGERPACAASPGDASPVETPARAALTVATHGPAWIGVIAALPDDIGRTATEAVVEAIPAGLGQAARLLVRWDVTSAADALRRASLSTLGGDNEAWKAAEIAWARAAAGVLARQPVMVAAAFTPLPSYGKREALEMWWLAPSSLLDDACADLIRPGAATSYPNRDAQIAAAGILLERGRERVKEQAWRTLVGIIDAGGEPMGDAITMARSYLDAAAPTVAAARSSTLTALLADIALAGRSSFLGEDPAASLRAAQALLDLGAADRSTVESGTASPGTAESGAARSTVESGGGRRRAIVTMALATLRRASTEYDGASYAPLACSVLAAAAAGDAESTRAAQDLLTTLVEADARLSANLESDTVANDVAFLAAARRASAMLSGARPD